MIKKAFSNLGILLLNGLSHFPLKMLYILASVLYYILYYVIGYRRKVVKENLTNAFPKKSAEQIQSIEKKYYRYLTSLMVEIIKLASMSKTEVQSRFRIKNLEVMTKYLDAGQSVVACTAHYGNWELGTLALGLQTSVEVYPIYKPLSNPAFEKWFTDLRNKFGNHMIPMRQTLRVLTESKARPTLFLFANDQTPVKSDAKHWVGFLNQPTAVLLGMEKIAVRNNRPVFYFKTTVLKRGYYEAECIPICMEPALLQPNEINMLHVRIVEKQIEEQPEYWLWSHRRWKHKPDV
jgi:KDO2-lipid IV(A) lauroyltransferase